LPRVIAASFTVDLCQLLCAPELVQTLKSRKKLIRAFAFLKLAVVDVDRNDIGEAYFVDVMGLSGRLVLLRDIGREAAFCFCSFVQDILWRYVCHGRG
jgi:hypothetical protein